MKREEYKQRLNELLEEDETLTHGSPDEILYMIDNMVIFGGYELGNRSVDHNILEFDDVSWEEILDWEFWRYLKLKPILVTLWFLF